MFFGEDGERLIVEHPSGLRANWEMTDDETTMLIEGMRQIHAVSDVGDVKGWFWRRKPLTR